MLIVKLSVVVLLFSFFVLFSIRLTRRGISRRYEPRAKSPWNSLNEGEDPSL